MQGRFPGRRLGRRIGDSRCIGSSPRMFTSIRSSISSVVVAGETDA